MFEKHFELFQSFSWREYISILRVYRFLVLFVGKTEIVLNLNFFFHLTELLNESEDHSLLVSVQKWLIIILKKFTE